MNEVLESGARQQYIEDQRSLYNDSGHDYLRRTMFEELIPMRSQYESRFSLQAGRLLRHRVRHWLDVFGDDFPEELRIPGTPVIDLNTETGNLYMQTPRGRRIVGNRDWYENMDRITSVMDKAIIDKDWRFTQ